MRDLDQLAPGAPHRPVAAARRVAFTGAVVSRHGLRLARRVGAREHTPSAAANELRRAFEALGPTYVKLAQLIASSPGLFPDVLADEVIAVISAELGDHPDALFARFDRDPIASASIAQVHAAELPDGTEVVVKVQRPGIAPQLRADVAILQQLARVIERTSVKARMANPVAVLEDFTATLARELNFVTEARSMEQFEANLRRFGTNDTVRVPTVHWPLTTCRVLTMERIHGYKIDDLAQLGATGWDLAGALKKGVRAWMESALEHGFFHGDLHAGNLMLDTEGNVVFLDFGICGTLDDHTRDIVRTGLPALLIDKDYQAVAQSIYQMGAILRPADLEQSARDIAEIVEPLLDRPLSEISYGEVLIDIVRIGTSYDVRLPRELVLVAKQMLYFERYAKLMAPDWTILDDPDLIGFLFDTVHTPD